MTLTTEVRINYPVPAIRLLDHVTRVAGGDPATVKRNVGRSDDPNFVCNIAGQGLRTLAMVRWTEQPDEGYRYEDYYSPAPPALVILSIDNPYGGGRGPTGREVQANEILPAVAEWLDEQGVPCESWWWEDETAGTYHPGICDVRNLNNDLPRPEWEPAESSSR